MWAALNRREKNANSLLHTPEGARLFFYTKGVPWRDNRFCYTLVLQAAKTYV